jgi:acyl carrier protein
MGMDSGNDPGLMQDPRTGEILEIVAKETGIARERLTPDAGIQELGIASLDMVQAIFAIESKYDVEIPAVTNAPGAEFETVGGLLTHVLQTLDRERPAQA